MMICDIEFGLLCSSRRRAWEGQNHRCRYRRHPRGFLSRSSPVILKRWRKCQARIAEVKSDGRIERSHDHQRWGLERRSKSRLIRFDSDHSVYCRHSGDPRKKPEAVRLIELGGDLLNQHSDHRPTIVPNQELQQRVKSKEPTPIRRHLESGRFGGVHGVMKSPSFNRGLVGYY